MHKGNKSIISNILIHVVYLIFLYLLQGLVFPLFARGWVPMLLCAASVGLCIGEGDKGVLFALFAGMLNDISLGKPTIVFTLLYTILGFFISFLCKTLFTRRFLSYMILCATVFLICSAAQLIGVKLYYEVSTLRLLPTLLLQTVVSLFFAALLYPLNRKISYRTMKLGDTYA